MIKKILLSSILFFSSLISAQKIKLNVESITPFQTLETKDEVYIALTSYSSFEKPNHKEIPEFPNYLNSDSLSELDKLNIWNGSIPKGEYINFKIAFVDRDNPPLNPDDLIGIVSVKIENKDGKLFYTYKDQVSGIIVTNESMPILPFKLKTRKSFYQTRISVDLVDETIKDAELSTQDTSEN